VLGIGPSCTGALQAFRATAVTASGVDFQLDPGVLGLLTAGEYRACICDSSADKVPLSPSGVWYMPGDECVERSPAYPVASLLSEWSEHLCSAKCPNCLGDECWCDAAAEPGSLCLPQERCREACSDHPDCAGFVAREGGTACTLLTKAPNCTKGREIPNLVQFAKIEVSPCGVELTPDGRLAAEKAKFDAADSDLDAVLSTEELKAIYKKPDFGRFIDKADVDKSRTVSFGEYLQVMGRYRDLGPITVTGKAHVGLTYVLPPGQPAALEVSGADLADIVGISQDRVMVVDSDAACGADEPARNVLEPTDWDEWAPEAVLVPVAAPGAGGGVQDVSPVARLQKYGLPLLES
jgi:hypothetical protein